jgi:hypothetical protein
MFIGHFAPALVAATHKDAPSLPVLFIGAQLVDWAFFALLLTGHEAMRVSPGISVMNPMDLYHMPWTHSLVGSIAWGAAFGLLISLWTRRRTAALLAFAVVVSHWLLDLIVHVPDLTIAGSAPKLGLGLWNHPMIEMPLEIGITLGALWWFKAKTGARTMPVAMLAGVLLLLQAVNWFGPPPTEVNAGTSLLAFFAYGAATLAAWWAGRAHPRPGAGRPVEG